MSFIEPDAQYAYTRQQQGASTTLQAALANLARQRGDLNAQQGLDTAALTRQYDSMREKLPGQYAARGLLNSGIYGEGLQHYGQARQQASQSLAQKYTGQLNNLTQSENNANATYNTSMANIDSQAALRRADLAAQLKGLQ